MIEKIREIAKSLLENKIVNVVIGWGGGSGEKYTTPIFITSPDDIDRLVWNPYCFTNLSLYLTKPEIKKYDHIAVISKGCDNKAIIGLLQEFQIKREDVYIIGVVCEGVGNDELLQKCKYCEVKTPREYDVLVGEPISASAEPDPMADVEQIEHKTPEEKWEFWKTQFEKCIRCYACRQICPLCYCEKCIAEKNQPQWINAASHSLGNFLWNIIRAYHLAGRCIECGECERACPIGIPLMLLNRKLAKEIFEQFSYKAGVDKNAIPGGEVRSEK